MGRRAAWGAGIVLALVAAWALTGPAARLLGEGREPELVVTAGVPVGEPWSAGWDGRPRERVVLTVTASVARRDGGDVPATVVGLAGPGISTDADGALTPPVTVPATATERRPVPVPLQARIDCDPVLDAALRGGPGATSDAYRLRVAVGTGAAPRVEPAGTAAAGRTWADAVRAACATWTARRDLTLTAVTARVDPAASAVDLTVTVSDAGRWGGTVATPADRPRHLAVRGDLPLHVPPHGTATAHLHLALDRCDVVGSVAYGAVGAAVLSDRIALVATAGGTSTGLVLARSAAQSLGAALGSACGDVGPPAATIPPGGVTYTAQTHELTVATVVQVARSVVRAMTLEPDPDQPGPARGAVPTWNLTDELRPDGLGRVPVTLGYRVIGPEPCGALGATLFGLLATLHVPTAAGERVVRYSLSLDMAQDDRASVLLCGRPGASPSASPSAGASTAR